MDKVAIVARTAERIGLATKVTPIGRHLSFKSVAQMLRNCDFVFGCTDDQHGRSVLSRLSVYYLIPVLDVGVSIDPDGERVRSIHGRVTILQPGYACLFCRGRITSEGVAADILRATDPQRAEQMIADGYIAGWPDPAPAVVTFTSMVASAAIAEMLDRLVGYKSAETKPSEYILRFEADTVGRNTRECLNGCFCSDRVLWGVGDKKLFLGMTWRPEHL
jgi:hypothetical protein